MAYNAYNRPWVRNELKRGERRKGPLIAYDFETTPIPRTPQDSMTLEPRYLTAYGESFRFSREVRTYETLAAILREHFLVPELRGARFVAWNGNRFDARLCFEAVGAHLEEYIVFPYIAGKGGLRGARIERRDDPKMSWEFLDGVAMTGLVGRPLSFFLERFAPDYQKLTGTIDFERERFNPRNPAHVAYAERDSEGLYYGLVRADEILLALSGRGLQCTIGNSGIKYFTSKIPHDVKVWPVRGRLHDAMRGAGYRGGYVYVSKQYDGPVWSYDLNSAYPAAMREQDLPCGDSVYTLAYDSERPGAYFCYLSRATRAPHPFYVKDVTERRMPPRETFGEGVETFLLSCEIDTLRRHGWTVDIREGWFWKESFRMNAMIDEIEHVRQTCEGGSSGPIGLMMKSLANCSYGKSAEVVMPLRVVIAKKCPEHFNAYRIEDPMLKYYWCAFEEEGSGGKPYHRPQIASFITASVRCKLYDAIMAAPDAFLKADTDSVAFSHDVVLDIHPSRFGAWKQENDGNRHIILGKKVYAAQHGDDWSFVCKGLSTRRLSVEIYERWFRDGCPPVQDQVQLQSWKASLGLSYRVQQRRGTDFERIASRRAPGVSSPFDRSTVPGPAP